MRLARWGLLLSLLCLGTGHAATLLLLDSQPDDYIGGGVLQEISSPVAAFVGTVSRDANSVSITFATGPYWTVDLAAPEGQTLAPGPYEDAFRYPSGIPTEPSLNVFGDGRGCGTLTGRFFIEELVRAPDGTLARFAADFEQHCEDFAPALFGAVRFNSNVPVTRPCADTDRDGKQDSTDVCPGTSYGEVINQAGCAIAQFCALFDAATEAGREACLRADWMNNKLRMRTASSDCRIVNGTCVPNGESSRPDSVLVLNSQPGDFIGGGLQQRFTRADGQFVARPNYDNGVTVFFNGFPQHFWSLDFAAPFNAQLVPGPYEGATRFPFQIGTTAPGLAVAGDGRGCNTLSGRFVVDDILQVGPVAQVRRFTAEFEQHCEEQAPALLGMIHYTRPMAFGLTCLDTDGDGEADATDACPGTPPGEPVDQAGCSREQFCERVSPARSATCQQADWRNDSPTRAPRDCIFNRVSGHCAAR